MDWEEFNQTLGALASADLKGRSFVKVIKQMVKLLDEADWEDFFGTEGWKHRLGLED